jgi:hypothetical protein
VKRTYLDGTALGTPAETMRVWKGNQNGRRSVNYWANELGVSRDALRSAVAKAGPMVKNVRDQLQLRD